jgi:hypothetical protein
MTNLLVESPSADSAVQHSAHASPPQSDPPRVDSSLSLTDFSANDFGYDVGAGVMGYFANHVGVRAGVQYFRNFERTGENVIGLDAGQFNFFRGSIGVLFRF